MAQVVWSLLAVEQVDEAAQYIAKDSPDNANNFVQCVVLATKRLETFPEIGAVVPQLKKQAIREILVFSYRILYRLSDDQSTVRVVGVVHGARRLTKDLIDF